jgi:hypothetical protein
MAVSRDLPAHVLLDILCGHEGWQSYHRPRRRLTYAYVHHGIRGPSFLSRIWRDSLLIVNLGPFAKQIATMQWVQERTSIPVPKILAYELDHSHALGAHIFFEKARFCFSALQFV